MKTLISKTTLIIAILIVLSSYIFASATIFSYSNKAYVKNAPCVNSSVTENYEKAIAVNYFLEDEDYINDIPFETNNVADKLNYLNVKTEDFNIEEESYIDDIPFNTKEMVQLFNR